MFGYCLMADTSQQKAFMLIGPKRSGKGTIARILEAVIGPYNCISPTLSSLGTAFGLQPFLGKRLATISDARISGKTDTSIVAERVLAITGEDSVTVDRKYLGPWTGKLDTRFLVISNELPAIADASGALPSRFILLMMTQSFYGQEDRGLTGKLLSERSAILNWAITGYERLCERGYFEQPTTAADALRELEDLASPIAAFVRDRCDIAPTRCIRIDNLYAAWCAWCEEQGRDQPGIKQRFGRNLRTVLPQVKITNPRTGEAGKQERTYEGIALR
jgi:putative DNA primase/helicase